MDLYILDENKQCLPVDDFVAWGEWFATADRTVAKTDIGSVHVSTVFLAIDHNWGSCDTPLLFETIVFGGVMEGHQVRYPDWESAEMGHGFMVEEVKAKEQALDW